jgi:hypothetical protein
LNKGTYFVESTKDALISDINMTIPTLSDIQQAIQETDTPYKNHILQSMGMFIAYDPNKAGLLFQLLEK